jgi:hypothetical protein
MERAAGNGGSAQLSALASEFDRLNALVHQVTDTGAEIKDLAQGLIDFRTRRGGSEVFLCWRQGESEIEFWHEIDAGFAGRRPMAEF